MSTKKSVPVQSQPIIAEGSYDVELVNELNFFDLMGSKGTKGTSNKMYHAELQVSKDKTNAQIMTMYGPTGSVQKKEWRHFTDVMLAKKEYEKILSGKRKKGYKDIDVAQRALGSDESKKITKAVVLKNADDLTSKKKTTIRADQSRIVDIFFGAQDHFIATTLKCPLGQLTNKQIDDGRACLDAAKGLINGTHAVSDKDQELLRLTNEFYGLIPHNLGSGARGQMQHLLLDDISKIMQKESDLDTLLDAKQVNAVLKSDSGADDKYNSLNCDFEEVSKSTELFKFLASYFQESKVRGHGYDNEKVRSIWKMHRKDAKELAFNGVAKRIANECGDHHFENETSKLSGNKSKLWTPKNRPDLSKEEKELYQKSNTWLCWHGTRSANLVGITRRGLLIRPSGAVHTGSMYGDGKYFAWQSTKSLNYCDGGYWTGGNSGTNKFMFLLDVSFGNMHYANGSHFYKGAPKGTHSVYARSGYAGVRNDEMITYDFDDKDNQSSIKYLFEIG